MAFGENGAVLVFLLLTTAMVGTTLGAVHNVGGSAGWTSIGNVDYKKWASGSTFHVDDSLAFVYNSQFHNVKQVTRQDFLACNASSPVATYTSGSDTVALKRPGHYYFLCGFPGHCQAGQKLYVLVTKMPTSSSVPRPSSSPIAAAGPSAPPSAVNFQSPGPAPTAIDLQSGAAKLRSTSGFLASVYGALVVLVASFM